MAGLSGKISACPTFLYRGNIGDSIKVGNPELLRPHAVLLPPRDPKEASQTWI